tara:strand:- start:703 stop:897 length:195 start_codon:yes stop_codon:yes gene_type:complete
MNDEQLVIEIKRGRVGMRQVVDEDMMRREPDREERLLWLFWQCYEAFEKHETKAIAKDVMQSKT